MATDATLIDPPPAGQPELPPVQTARPAWLALLPLLISIPCMYWPKLIDADTQPWVVIGAATGALFYWPLGAHFSKAFPVIPTILGVLAVGAYWMRSPDSDLLLRYGVIIFTFVMLWQIGNRGVDRTVGTIVRFTVVLWFLVGLYQSLAVRLGLPIDFFGRYVAGRGGVPSLTAEASYYGSISTLHLMYIIADRRRYDWIFYPLAVGSVLLSGSILSFVLLIIPFFRLPTQLKVAVGLAGLAALLLGVDLMSSGFFARLASLEPSAITDSLLSDYSTNLRAGHIVFTYWDALGRELLFRNGVDFFYEYNQWAFTSNTFVFNDSGFILPAGGELLFRSGSVGLLILMLMARTAFQTAETTKDRIEKVAFVLACMLNPISLTNPVFVLYIHQRQNRQ